MRCIDCSRTSSQYTLATLVLLTISIGNDTFRDVWVAAFSHTIHASPPLPGGRMCCLIFQHAGGGGTSPSDDDTWARRHIAPTQYTRLLLCIIMHLAAVPVSDAPNSKNHGTPLRIGCHHGGQRSRSTHSVVRRYCGRDSGAAEDAARGTMAKFVFSGRASNIE